MAFDIEGARKAGYSDADIVTFLGKQKGFDVVGAKAAGYTDQQMLPFLQDLKPKAGFFKTAGRDILSSAAKFDAGAATLGQGFTAGMGALNRAVGLNPSAFDNASDYWKNVAQHEDAVANAIDQQQAARRGGLASTAANLTTGLVTTPFTAAGAIANTPRQVLEAGGTPLQAAEAGAMQVPGLAVQFAAPGVGGTIGKDILSRVLPDASRNIVARSLAGAAGGAVTNAAVSPVVRGSENTVLPAAMQQPVETPSTLAGDLGFGLFGALSHASPRVPMRARDVAAPESAPDLTRPDLASTPTTAMVPTDGSEASAQPSPLQAIQQRLAKVQALLDNAQSADAKKMAKLRLKNLNQALALHSDADTFAQAGETTAADGFRKKANDLLQKEGLQPVDMGFTIHPEPDGSIPPDTASADTATPPNPPPSGIPDAAPEQRATLALPAPTIVGQHNGPSLTAADQRAQSGLGLTPDVRSAQQRHPGFVPITPDEVSVAAQATDFHPDDVNADAVSALVHAASTNHLAAQHTVNSNASDTGLADALGAHPVEQPAPQSAGDAGERGAAPSVEPAAPGQPASQPGRDTAPEVQVGGEVDGNAGDTAGPGVQGSGHHATGSGGDDGSGGSGGHGAGSAAAGRAGGPGATPVAVPDGNTDAGAVTQNATKALPVQEVPLSDIQPERGVKQFKLNAGANGLVDRLQGKFDRTGVAPVQLWRRLNGKLYVISGSHRRQLAEDSGEKTIPAQVHNEANGFGPSDAATLDAVLNIRDGQGTAADYANYFKHVGLSADEANDQGLLRGAKHRQAFAVATEGSPATFAAHRAGQLSDQAAAQIAHAAPKNEALQNLGVQQVQAGKPIADAVNTMHAVEQVGGDTSGAQGDMFGLDDSAMQKAQSMAREASKRQRAIREQIAAVQGAAKRPEKARALGVNVDDPEAVKASVAQLKQQASQWDNWWMHPDLVKDIGGDGAVRASEPDAPSTADVGGKPSVQAATTDATPTAPAQSVAQAKPATLELTGQTNAEIARDEAAQKERDRQAAAQAERDRAPGPEGFTLTGSSRDADVGSAAGQQSLLDGRPHETRDTGAAESASPLVGTARIKAVSKMKSAAVGTQIEHNGVRWEKRKDEKWHQVNGFGTATSGQLADFGLSLDEQVKVPTVEAPDTSKDRSARPVEITENELGRGTNDDLRRRAMAVARNRINAMKGEPVTVESTGDKVRIPMSGIRHTLHGAGADLIRTATKVPELLRSARKIGTEPYRGNDSNVKLTHKYVSDASVGGKRKRVVLTVLEDHQGNKYYDHGFENTKPAAARSGAPDDSTSAGGLRSDESDVKKPTATTRSSATAPNEPRSGGVSASGDDASAFSREATSDEARSPDDAEVARIVQQYASVKGAPSESDVREAVKQYREVEHQNAEVLRAHREDGKPLPAPNGKQSKLNARQWVQVRTLNFKGWFGDWEGVLHRAFLDGKPVATLSGDEFKSDGRPLSLKVPKWYAEHGVSTVEVPGIGRVSLDAVAVKNSLSHGIGRDKAAAFAAVPDILKNGRIVHREPLRGARDAGRVFHVAAPIKIGGRDFVADVVVKADPNMRRMYVHEVALREKLQQGAFKTGAGAAEAGVRTGANNDAGAIRSVLQRIYAVNPDSASKVVDTNGEPQAVYHGTTSDFDSFKRGAASMFDYHGRPDGGGFFFSARPSGVDYYMGGRNIYERGANVVPAFLAIKDPVNLSRSGFRSLDEQSDALAKAEREGHDGARLGSVWVAFRPDQIKSALSNVGTFSDRDNIDFRRGDHPPASGEVENEPQPHAGVSRSGDNARSQEHANGIPKGRKSEGSLASARLTNKFNRWRQAVGLSGNTQFREIPRASLPDALGRALASLESAAGVRVHVVRNLTPELDKFNGLTFRDGDVFVDETAPHPLTAVASHEFVHNLKKSHSDLYQQLEDEVRRQGRVGDWQKELSKRANGETVNEKLAAEELTANAVGDAMSDPEFLRRMAERNPSGFAGLARRFIAYLNNVLGKVRGLGSDKYLSDVAAFRDRLAAVLDEYSRRTKAGEVPEKLDWKAMFQRVFHGSPHRGIEKEGFKLNKIGTGEGAQAYGRGIYFAAKREVAEAYKRTLEKQRPATYAVSDGRVVGRDERQFAHDLELARTGGDAAVQNMLNALTQAGVEDGETAFLRGLLGKKVTVKEGEPQPGQLYHAEVPEDHELLDWDKPLSEQPEEVRNALEPLLSVTRADVHAAPDSGRFGWLGRSALADIERGDVRTGRDLYEALSAGGKARQASEYLNSIGIPGLRYLDSGSRGNGDGTHNYVIWDESRLTPENAKIEAMFARGDSPFDDSRKAQEGPQAAAEAMQAGIDMHDDELVRRIGRGSIGHAFAVLDRVNVQTAHALRGWRNTFDRMMAAKDGQKHIDAAVDEWESGKPVSDPKLAPFFKSMKQAFDQRVDAIRETGRTMGYLQNYFPHLYKDPKKAANWMAIYLSHRPFEGTKGWTKQRVYETLQAAREAGLEPMFNNPADMVQAHLAQLDKYIALHQVRTDLDARHLVMDDNPNALRKPAGWAKVDDPAFRGKLIPQMIANDIHTTLGPGMRDVGAIRLWLNTKNSLVSLQLGLSAFHATMTTGDTVASHLSDAILRTLMGDGKGAVKSLVDTVTSPVLSPLRGHKLAKQALHEEAADAQTSAILRMLEQGGQRVQMSLDDHNQSYQQLAQLLRQGAWRKDYKGTAETAWRAAQTLAENVTPLIHEYLVPAQKMTAKVLGMKMELDRVARRLGQPLHDYSNMESLLTEDAIRQIASRVVNHVDDRLGQRNYRNLYLNRKVLDGMQMAVMSPGWQIGSFNTLVGGASDVVHLLGNRADKLGKASRFTGDNLIRGQVTKAGDVANLKLGPLTDRLAYLVALQLLVAGVTTGITYAVTGTGPKDVRDFYTIRTGRTNPDGTAERLSFPSYIRDEAELMHGITHNPLAPFSNLKHMAGNKLSPVARMLGDLASNRDWRGNEIFLPSASATTKLEQVAHYVARQGMPFAIEGMFRSHEAGGGVAQDVANTFGFNPAPGQMTRTPFFDILHEHSQDPGHVVLTPEQAKASDAFYKQLSNARVGRPVDFSKLTIAQRHKLAVYRRTSAPEAAFKRLSIWDKLEAYRAASPAERERYHLKRWLLNTRTGFTRLNQQQRMNVFQDLRDVRAGREPSVMLDR